MLLLLFVIVVVEGIFPREIVVVGGFLRIFFFFLCIQICVLSPPLVHFTLFFFQNFEIFSLLMKIVFFFILLCSISFHFSNSFFDTLHKVIFIYYYEYISFFFIFILQILFCWILFIV